MLKRVCAQLGKNCKAIWTQACKDLKDKKGDERLLGYVHYPEVMFTIFHSVAGVNDDAVIDCKTVKDNLKELRYKYRKLEKNITLD